MDGKNLSNGCCFSTREPKDLKVTCVALIIEKQYQKLIKNICLCIKVANRKSVF